MWEMFFGFGKFFLFILWLLGSMVLVGRCGLIFLCYLVVWVRGFFEYFCFCSGFLFFVIGFDVVGGVGRDFDLMVCIVFVLFLFWF